MVYRTGAGLQVGSAAGKAGQLGVPHEVSYQGKALLSSIAWGGRTLGNDINHMYWGYSSSGSESYAIHPPCSPQGDFDSQTLL